MKNDHFTPTLDIDQLAEFAGIQAKITASIYQFVQPEIVIDDIRALSIAVFLKRNPKIKHMESVSKTANEIINCSDSELDELNGYLVASNMRVILGVDSEEGAKPDGDPPTCPQGYVWSPSEGKCILDIG